MRASRLLPQMQARRQVRAGLIVGQFRKAATSIPAVLTRGTTGTRTGRRVLAIRAMTTPTPLILATVETPEISAPVLAARPISGATSWLTRAPVGTPASHRA